MHNWYQYTGIDTYFMSVNRALNPSISTDIQHISVLVICINVMVAAHSVIPTVTLLFVQPFWFST